MSTPNSVGWKRSKLCGTVSAEMKPFALSRRTGKIQEGAKRDEHVQVRDESGCAANLINAKTGVRV